MVRMSGHKDKPLERAGFLFLCRYISGLVAWFYILLLPFVACIPAIDPLVQILLRIVQFPLVAGRNIRDGTMNIEEDEKK